MTGSAPYHVRYLLTSAVDSSAAMDGYYSHLGLVKERSYHSSHFI